VKNTWSWDERVVTGEKPITKTDALTLIEKIGDVVGLSVEQLTATPSNERDYFAEGVEAAISGASDIAPDDVVESGLDNEASWNDGYASVMDVYDDGD